MRGVCPTSGTNDLVFSTRDTNSPIYFSYLSCFYTSSVLKKACGNIKIADLRQATRGNDLAPFLDIEPEKILDGK